MAPRSCVQRRSKRSGARSSSRRSTGGSVESTTSIHGDGHMAAKKSARKGAKKSARKGAKKSARRKSAKKR